MKSDIEIAQQVRLKPILEIAAAAGIGREYVECHGDYKAKITLGLLDALGKRADGRLVLVTAITPTAFGEGKTTVSIGLSMALNRIGKKSIVAIRQPSLGPVFGIKGGAAGGGFAQVLPMEEINLHFTGDIHAVAAAHNLLAAVLDNHVHFGNPLAIDEREITLPRTIDINDRALRSIVVGLGGKPNGPAREDRFIITAASEVMAILALSSSIRELKERICRIIVASNMAGKPVTAGDLGACGAMAVLLKDAVKPNLVQTAEQTPAFVHAGPFANIAHGASSVIATRMALKLSDYTVTEAGFGSDLGAEKFVGIVCRSAGFKVAAGVIVATVRALKLHGGAPAKQPASGTVAQLKKGLANLGKHIENMGKFGIRSVVAVNVFEGDTADEVEIIQEFCRAAGVRGVPVNAHERGSEGAVELAREVAALAENGAAVTRPVYELGDTVEQKINKVATEIYGADRVAYTPKAEKDLMRIEKTDLAGLPVCIAKTNRSLSDDPAVYGRPQNFKITITDIKIASGAGFLVPLAGEVMLMPGLAKVPNAARIDIDANGKITGLS